MAKRLKFDFGWFILTVILTRPKRRRALQPAPEPINAESKLPLTLRSDFDYNEQRYIVEARRAQTGRYNTTRVWIHYANSGRQFESPVDLYRLRLWCRKVAYSDVSLAYRYWTSNEAPQNRPPGAMAIFSKHEYADLLAELEKHGFVSHTTRSYRSPFALTDAGRDFAHLVMRQYKTEKRQQ